MRTSFDGVNIIGKGVDAFIVRIAVLHGDFCRNAIAGTFEIDHIRMNRKLSFVQVAHKLTDAAFVFKGLFALRLFLCQADTHTAIQERQFAQT